MSKPHRRQKAIPAAMSEQQEHNSYCPITEYVDKRVPCADCGRPVLWTAEQQLYWYEEIKASMYAQVSLRCDTCRERGRHDKHKQAQRAKARRRGR